MIFILHGLKYDTEKSKLIHTTEIENRGIFTNHFSKTYYYLTPNKKLFKIVQYYDRRGQRFFLRGKLQWWFPNHTQEDLSNELMEYGIEPIQFQEA